MNYIDTGIHTYKYSLCITQILMFGLPIDLKICKCEARL